MTDGPASPRRTGTSGDAAPRPAAEAPRPAAEILAEATNLRAARLRDALELARVRRLEAEAMHKERDQARRERDVARQALDRVRSRLVVRAALWAMRHVRRALGRVRKAGPAVGPGTAGAAADAPAAARLVGRIRGKPAAGVGPAEYRSRLLGRLGGKGRPILASVVGESSERLAKELRAMGWSVPGFGPGSAADVLVVASPAHDPREVARETILVAAVSGDAEAWTAQPWFDAFDVVLVGDEAAAERVAGTSAKAASVAEGGPDAWPAASAVAAAVRDWASRTRIAVMVQALRWDVAEPSGDYHLARALQRQFERRGHPTSVYFQRQWSSIATAREDVVIHLWGRYELAARPTQVNALWILYHPELVTDDLCRRYDAVFAASDTLARRLSHRTGLEVKSLHQATDAERFRPTPGGPHHELLFVANSRGTRRTIIDDLTPTARDLGVYGGGWADDLLDPAYFRGAVVSNRDLPAYYAAADIVLNDHWLESAEAGMINNRLYDALAAGAMVISDAVPGLDEEFDGAVVTYRDPADLALIVEQYLADPAARQALAERGRRAVLERHTVSHRADELLDALLPLVRARDGDQPKPPAPPAGRAAVGARRR